MSFQRVAGAEDLWPGEMRGVVLGARKILLVHAGGEVHAYRDACAHKGVELSKGRLDGCLLTCFAHAWTYDACAGHGVNPSSASLFSYPVKVDRGEIWVDPGDE